MLCVCSSMTFGRAEYTVNAPPAAEPAEVMIPNCWCSKSESVPQLVQDYRVWGGAT